MFKAIAWNSCFSRRISRYPQDPVPANHAPNASPSASIPIKGAQPRKPPRNIEAAEDVPVKFKHSGLPTYVPVQKTGIVADNFRPNASSSTSIPIESAQCRKPPRKIEAAKDKPVKFKHSGLPTYVPVEKTGNFAPNASSSASIPIESAQPRKPPRNIEAAEDVLVKFKHSGLPTYVPVQKTGIVADNFGPNASPSASIHVESAQSHKPPRIMEEAEDVPVKFKHSGLPTYVPVRKTGNFAPNASPSASIPIESAQRRNPPRNIEKAEVVPVKFKHSGLPTYVPVQKTGIVADNFAPNASPSASIPIESAQPRKAPRNIEAAEDVPVKFKQSGLPTYVPVQKTGIVADNFAPNASPSASIPIKSALSRRLKLCR